MLTLSYTLVFCMIYHNFYLYYVLLNLILDVALTSILVTEKTKALERVSLLVSSLDVILSNKPFP
jgi:hypothetical protein